MTTRATKSTTAKQGTPKPKASRDTNQYANPPKTLDEHYFYRLRLDEDQKKFRQAIWDKNIQIVFCDARAGTGKTTIAVATADLLVKYGLFSEIIYITSACHERKQGFLSGSLYEKSREYFAPLYDALETIGIQAEKVIHSDDVITEKYDPPYITAITDTYIRGRNFGNADKKVIVIADESQNMTMIQLKTLLSRIGEGSMAIVIGHSKQCDLLSVATSGFTRCLRHYSDREWAAACTLTKNYRSKISQWADEMPDN